MKLSRLKLPTSHLHEMFDFLSTLFEWPHEVIMGEQIFSVNDIQIQFYETTQHQPFHLHFSMSSGEFEEFKQRLEFFEFRKKLNIAQQTTSNILRLSDSEGNTYHISKSM